MARSNPRAIADKKSLFTSDFRQSFHISSSGRFGYDASGPDHCLRGGTRLVIRLHESILHAVLLRRCRYFFSLFSFTFASTTDFMLASPFSNSPPSIFSMSMKRQTALLMK